MTNSISRLLIKADHLCDYIPIVSTINNLTDLFHKHVVFHCMTEHAITNNHYYTHLNQKSTVRCIILLIPLIGNIVVGVHDCMNRPQWSQETMSATVQPQHDEARHPHSPPLLVFEHETTLRLRSARFHQACNNRFRSRC